MKRLEKVRQIQTGITTRCNSHCRFCFREELLRTEHADKMPFKHKPIDIPFDIYKRIFQDTNLTDVQFCGNKGDAIFHPEFEKILNYTIDKGVFVSLSTNGSAFSNSWWKELPKRMTRGEVTFALDGLDQETHSMYRGTDFNKVYNHMLSFIEGGGRARWQFIVFKHNEHQVEDVRKLAKEIGCKVFIKVLSRTYDDIMQRPTEVPDTKRELNKKIANFPNLQKTLLSQMKCPWVRMGRVYVSSEGNVYPCCYITCSIHGWYTSPSLMYLTGLNNEHYNLSNHTIPEILHFPMFKEVYDNIHKIKLICGLHCITWDFYKAKIRREEEI